MARKLTVEATGATCRQDGDKVVIDFSVAASEGVVEVEVRMPPPAFHRFAVAAQRLTAKLWIGKLTSSKSTQE